MRRATLFVFVLFAAESNALAWGGAPDWVKQVAAQQLPSYPADTPAVGLLDEQITTVTDDGEIRTLYRQAIKILTTEGKDYAYHAIPFDSETTIRSLYAWSVTAKGEEYQIK